MSYGEAVRPGVHWFPKNITFDAYALVFANGKIVNGLFVSVAVTAANAAYQLMLTALAAYALTKKDLPGRQFLFLLMIVPMYFRGGLIPDYLLIKRLGLINNLLVMILPFGASAYNVIVMRSFFSELPVEMEESATIDGAGYFRIFFRMILPLSTPVVATIALFISVAQWNNWFTPMIYLNRPEQWPLALVLRDILFNSSAEQAMKNSAYVSKDYMLEDSLKMAIVVVSILPIAVVYPFVQKYFVKGVMLGAVKT
jgi:putative aldouronate transport system permease protein